MKEYREKNREKYNAHHKEWARKKRQQEAEKQT